MDEAEDSRMFRAEVMDHQYATREYFFRGSPILILDNQNGLLRLYSGDTEVYFHKNDVKIIQITVAENQ